MRTSTCTMHKFIIPTSKINLLNQTFFNTIISAKTPSVNNTLLPQVALKHDKHMLWGNFNPSAVCMIKNSCFKHFSKDFVDGTALGGAPMYFSYLSGSHDFEGKTAPWTCRTPEGSSVAVTIHNFWRFPYSPKPLNHVPVSCNCGA